MTTLAHALSGSIITLLFLRIPPNDLLAMLLSLGSASILDLDHLFLLWLKRDHFRKAGLKGQLHLARSFWHELLGLMIVALGALGLGVVRPKLAVLLFLPLLIHLAEDMLIGKFFPFTPFDRTEIRLISVPLRVKPLIDVLVLVLSGGLWVLYLSGRL